MYDLDYFGVMNGYFIVTYDNIALTYNDESVLENFYFLWFFFLC